MRDNGIAVWALGTLASLCVFAFQSQAGEPAREAVPVHNKYLENAHTLTDKVIAGAEPHDDAAFETLKEMGMKTVISVDGAKPNVELAHKFGLRYVHLPIGYDGVPVEREKELAKALVELDGPIYVHCHHGMHRAPAAAASACVVAGMINNDEAVAAMRKMGTGENYLGLWNSARTAKPISKDELQQLKVDYREATTIAPLAESMVHMDEAIDHVSDCKKAGWNAPKNHPDIDPAHEALKLRELLVEMTRGGDFRKRPADFREWTEKSINDAKALEELLRASKNAEHLPAKELDAIYKSMQSDCSSCHKVYRNVKPRMP